MDRPMGQVKQLDQRINDRGLLRLMPVEFLAQNMSNRTDWIHRPTDSVESPKSAASNMKRFLQVPVVKRVLLGVHDRIFRWYYD